MRKRGEKKKPASCIVYIVQCRLYDDTNFAYLMYWKFAALTPNQHFEALWDFT